MYEIKQNININIEANGIFLELVQNDGNNKSFKKLIERSRVCHNHKPQPTLDTKRKRKRTKTYTCKTNKQMYEKHKDQLPAARICTKWLYAKALGLVSNYDPALILTQFVLIQHILSTQVSDTWPMVLWLLTIWKKTAICMKNYRRFKGSSTCCVSSDLKRPKKVRKLERYIKQRSIPVWASRHTEYEYDVWVQAGGTFRQALLKSIHLPSLGRIFTLRC